MARQSKHIRFQVAHKAAQMMAEEGISDYAFAKRKAAKFFGLMDGDALPSNDEINDAIKEHQAIFFDEEHEERLKVLRLEALSLMKRLSAFNPHLTGGALDGTAGRYPTLHIQLYADSMKEVEFFYLIIISHMKHAIENHALRTLCKIKKSFRYSNLKAPWGLLNF